MTTMIQPAIFSGNPWSRGVTISAHHAALFVVGRSTDEISPPTSAHQSRAESVVVLRGTRREAWSGNSNNIKASWENVYANVKEPKPWTRASLTLDKRVDEQDHAAGSSTSPTSSPTRTLLSSEASSSRKKDTQKKTQVLETASPCIAYSTTPPSAPPSNPSTPAPTLSSAPSTSRNEPPQPQTKPRTVASTPTMHSTHFAMLPAFTDAKEFHELRAVAAETAASGDDKLELQDSAPPQTVKEKQKPGIGCVRHKMCLEDEEGLVGFDGEEWEILRGKGKGWECGPQKVRVREELEEVWAFVEVK